MVGGCGGCWFRRMFRRQAVITLRQQVYLWAWYAGAGPMFM